jgi:hypothetical protein
VHPPLNVKIIEGKEICRLHRVLPKSQISSWIPEVMSTVFRRGLRFCQELVFESKHRNLCFPFGSILGRRHS